jgi:hypothetical protein
MHAFFGRAAIIIVPVVSSNRALYYDAVALVELLKNIVAMYERHGWSLRRALMRPDSTPEPESSIRDLFSGVELRASDFDALWFSRPSDGRREAWELRLVAEQPYALFEAFEMDESEEDREEARLEMENRMRAYTTQ